MRAEITVGTVIFTKIYQVMVDDFGKSSLIIKFIVFNCKILLKTSKMLDSAQLIFSDFSVVTAPHFQRYFAKTYALLLL